MGAPSRDGLAGAAAPEPHAGLGPTDGIPSAFTAGPWAAFHDVGTSYFIDTALGIESTNEYVIADNIAGRDGEANARLIAAAPELYRQLQVFVSTIVNDDLLRLDPDLASEVDATQALLAKARGEQ